MSDKKTKIFTYKPLILFAEKMQKRNVENTREHSVYLYENLNRRRRSRNTIKNNNIENIQKRIRVHFLNSKHT